MEADRMIILTSLSKINELKKDFIISIEQEDWNKNKNRNPILTPSSESSLSINPGSHWVLRKPSENATITSEGLEIWNSIKRKKI